MRNNLESNETTPSSPAQKLSEIWDFKNGIWKKAVLRKFLFKILVFFFLHYEILYFTISNKIAQKCVLPPNWWKRYESSLKISLFPLASIWPPRSPNLTPVDYFLWGYPKDEVFRNRLKNFMYLKAKIEEKVRSDNTHMCNTVFQNVI